MWSCGVRNVGGLLPGMVDEGEFKCPIRGYCTCRVELEFEYGVELRDLAAQQELSLLGYVELEEEYDRSDPCIPASLYLFLFAPCFLSSILSPLLRYCFTLVVR